MICANRVLDSAGPLPVSVDPASNCDDTTQQYLLGVGRNALLPPGGTARGDFPVCRRVRRTWMSMFATLLICSPIGSAIEAADLAPDPTLAPANLTELSLDQLTQVQFVTSVSKKPERLSDAAAAIDVVTGDDLESTGATSIAEALRKVPGVFVGHVDSHTWAISSRGFNDAFGNKLLVLMDGRSVYTPLFSGVYWDVQDTMLEDLDRIEVVRGPGATMWGANAVNGVINIITKNARETQGTLVTSGGGNEEVAFASVRHGGQLSSNAFYRVYLKYNDRDSSVVLNSGGRSADDRWQILRGGLRLDWEPGTRDQITFQADAYGGEEDQTYRLATLSPPSFSRTTSRATRMGGGNVLGRWTRSLSENSEVRLQTYYDQTDRNGPLLEEHRDTVDVDLQHRFQLGPRQEINWGTSYRFTQDQLDDSFTLTFNPRHRGDHLIGLFGQDEVSLVPDHVNAAVGIKLEHNDYTGFEYQPRASIHYRPVEQHSLWASVSRAVRTPSRAEHDIRLNNEVFGGAPPLVVSIFGNPDFRSETVLAYEAGYRVQPCARVSADLALFYNEYEHLRTAEVVGGPAPDSSLPGTPLVQRVNLDNKAKAETYGAELSLKFRLFDWWNIEGAYAALEIQAHRERSSNDPGAELSELQAPHHQFRGQSSMTFPAGLRFDLVGRYVDGLSDFNIRAYWEMDARLSWSPCPNLEFSITGQNLLDDRHPEFWPTVLDTQRTEVQRSIFGKVDFRF